MKKIMVIIFVALFIVSAVLLMADRYPHRGTGVSIWFPNHWEVRQVGEAFYGISPDGQAVVQYIRLAAHNMQQARNTFRPSLEPQIQDFRITQEGPKFRRNNLFFKTIYGEARHKRADWAVTVFLIQTPWGMGMMVQRRVRAAGSYKVPFINILESLKPL
jgi:hypothetical protein